MKILYPANPLNQKEADEPYQEEYQASKQAGLSCALFDYDALDFEFKPKPRIDDGDIVLYRGWMMSPSAYASFSSKVATKGATLFTTPEQYVKCHHLPGWYQTCMQYTAETHFFTYDDSILCKIRELEWDRYFIKDYVKSNSNEVGSIADTPEKALEIIKLIELYRGGIEGGVAVRRVESYLPDSEQRHFVFKGKVYCQDPEAVETVRIIAELVDAPFYSVDTIKRSDGVTRVVEIGDGQVSDRKKWSSDEFVKILIENCS